jgi:pectinesterase
MFRIVTFFWFICCGLVNLQAQIISITNKPDTSFTVYSAFQKIYKKYPDARIVGLKNYPDVASSKDVVYLRLKSRELHADVFYPNNKQLKQAPGIVLIHGGGWRSGNKIQQDPMAEELAHHGYVAMSVEYRLSTEALYPAAVLDVKSAIKWLRSRAKHYHLNKDRIAILGCSSGGQMAALIGATNGKMNFTKQGIQDQSDSVQAIIDIDGILDFTNVDSYKFDTDPKKPSAAAYWFNGTYKDKPDVWKEGSAITYAGANTPPILFINSILPHYHAGRDEMIRILDSYKVYHQEFTIPDTPHPFWLFYPWYDTMMDYILSFLTMTINISQKCKKYSFSGTSQP